jgi:cysteinyl-tRNA synthetase
MPEWNDIGVGGGVSGYHAPPIGRIIKTGSRTLVSMTLHLHDSVAREVRQFQPVHPGFVSLYARGTTAPGLSGMGQLRLAVCVDIVIRWLEASGHRVTYCRNGTDLDKAVRVAAKSAGTPWWVLAEQARRHDTQGAAALACRPPDVDPRTDSQVPEMISCFGPVFDIHAESTDRIRPGQGRYCLPVGQAPVAGSMSAAADRVRAVEVRYFLAQAHYRAAIECSGAHLEEAAAAYQRIERFVTRADRMLFTPGGATPLSTPRHGGDTRPPIPPGPLPGGTGTNRLPPGFSAAGLGADHPPGLPATPLAGGTGTNRLPPGLPLAGLATNHPSTSSTTPPPLPGTVPISFAAAMDDDLDVPRALMAVHATVHDGNYAIKSGDRDAVAASLAQVRIMLAALGLDPLDPHWATPDSTGRLHGVIDGLVGLALRQQEAARARGDYASAGSIRDTLETMGVEVEDTATGPQWELRR